MTRDERAAKARVAAFWDWQADVASSDAAELYRRWAADARLALALDEEARGPVAAARRARRG